jgi:hypothetical protein
MLMLADALNRLAEPNRVGSDFASEARNLSEQEEREAATLHLAALLNARPEDSSLGFVRVGALEARLLKATDVGNLRYEDTGVAYTVSGATLAFNDGPRRLADLLEILLFARDRSDALFFLPPDLRQARFMDLAKRTGVSERFIRYFVAHAPAIERTLAI